MGMGIPVFNHNPGPCKLFHGIVFYIFIIINKFYMLPFLGADYMESFQPGLSPG